MISKRLIIPFTLALFLGAIFACTKEEAPVNPIAAIDLQETTDDRTDKCCLIDFESFMNVNGQIHSKFILNIPNSEFYIIRVKRLSDGAIWTTGPVTVLPGSEGCYKTIIDTNLSEIVMLHFNNCADQYQISCNTYLGQNLDACIAGDVSPVINLGVATCH